MAFENYPTVHILDDPLIKHKITKLRDKTTKTSEFKMLVKEISVLEGYEALRNAETQMVEIETPIEKTVQPVVKRKSLCFVPILRAGLGMADGMLDLLPGCTCGHIGLYRDEVTKKPVEYYCKLPADISEKDVYLVDPMLAAKKITFVCIIAAPEGVEAFVKKYPDIPVYIGALDRCLNENAYICPGLGDCGDRTFGTTNGTTEDKPII